MPEYSWYTVRRFEVSQWPRKAGRRRGPGVRMTSFMQKDEAEAWAAVANDWLMEQGAFQIASANEMAVYGLGVYGLELNERALTPRLGSSYVQRLQMWIRDGYMLETSENELHSIPFYRELVSKGKAALPTQTILIDGCPVEIAAEELIDGCHVMTSREFEKPPTFDLGWTTDRRGHYVALQDVQADEADEKRVKQ